VRNRREAEASLRRSRNQKIEITPLREHAVPDTVTLRRQVYFPGVPYACFGFWTVAWALPSPKSQLYAGVPEQPDVVAVDLKATVFPTRAFVGTVELQVIEQGFVIVMVPLRAQLTPLAETTSVQA